jgi:uncharacterized UBP type Zn finger protein
MGNSQPSYFSPQIFVPSPNTNLKGLINPLGENNCFLNVVIQSLWHLDSFSTPPLSLSSFSAQPLSGLVQPVMRRLLRCCLPPCANGCSLLRLGVPLTHRDKVRGN